MFPKILPYSRIPLDTNLEGKILTNSLKKHIFPQETIDYMAISMNIIIGEKNRELISDEESYSKMTRHVVPEFLLGYPFAQVCKMKYYKRRVWILIIRNRLFQYRRIELLKLIGRNGIMTVREVKLILLLIHKK